MWIDRAVKWLLPRETHFYEAHRAADDRAHEISALLANMHAQPRPRPSERRSSREFNRSSTWPTGSSPMCSWRYIELLSPRWMVPTSSPWQCRSRRVADAVFATALQFVVHAVEDGFLGELRAGSPGRQVL